MFVLRPEHAIDRARGRVDHAVRKRQAVFKGRGSGGEGELRIQRDNASLLHHGRRLERVVLAAFAEDDFEHFVQAHRRDDGVRRILNGGRESIGGRLVGEVREPSRGIDNVPAVGPRPAWSRAAGGGGHGGVGLVAIRLAFDCGVDPAEKAAEALRRPKWDELNAAAIGDGLDLLPGGEAEPFADFAGDDDLEFWGDSDDAHATFRRGLL